MNILYNYMFLGLMVI